MTTIDIDAILGDGYENDKYGNPGHFGTQYGVHFEIAIDSGKGYPFNHGLGGWETGAEGRVVTGGPMVPGPVAYLYGLGVMISATAQAAPLRVWADDGDVLIIKGSRYVLSWLKRPGDVRGQFATLTLEN